VHKFIFNFKVLSLKPDFKSGASIMPCMHSAARPPVTEFHRPLWLNADVFKGPGGL
jgi:hypothetical protein